MKKNINKNSVDCKLSEIYEEFDDLILLHGMSRIGAIDRVPREMFIRYGKIKENWRCGYLIKIGKPFKNWSAAGAIIKESKVITADEVDSGTDDKLNPITQMKTDEIKRIVKDINYSNLQNDYSELVYENAELQGIFYIKDPEITDYGKIDVRRTQEKFNVGKVYEIDHKSGTVFIVEWSGNDYKHVKEMPNRKELFNQ